MLRMGINLVQDVSPVPPGHEARCNECGATTRYLRGWEKIDYPARRIKGQLVCAECGFEIAPGALSWHDVEIQFTITDAECEGV